MPAFHASHRQSFGNIVVVALRIALDPRYFPRWLYGFALPVASLGRAGKVVGMQ